MAIRSRQLRTFCGSRGSSKRRYYFTYFLLYSAHHYPIPYSLTSPKDWRRHVALICSRSSDDWRRGPRVSCLYAFQIGAQCQRPSFPSFPRPSRLAVEESAATVFSRSQLLLFLLFTRVRLNNTKRGIQIPHIILNRIK